MHFFFFFYFIVNLCCTVLSFLKYFWCHNTCKLFRAQQSPQSGGADFGQNFERYRSRSICKLNLLSHKIFTQTIACEDMRITYVLRNQCVTFLNAFVVLDTSTGTDCSADCGEQSPNWEANCRGEQEEGAGRQESGALYLCAYYSWPPQHIMTQHIMLLACKHKRWENHEANDYQKDKLPSERKINTFY